MVYTLAKAQAETILLQSASTSVIEVMTESNFDYNDISKITLDANSNFKGIEIDIKKIALLKNRMAKLIPQKIYERKFFDVYIPIGTLTGFDFCYGFGPRISVPVQLTATVKLDYFNDFKAVGINNTLHQIMINTELRGTIALLGVNYGFTTETSEIAAQTVIVGEVPDTFTNVTETPLDDISDDIFNYAN